MGISIRKISGDEPETEEKNIRHNFVNFCKNFLDYSNLAVYNGSRKLCCLWVSRSHFPRAA